jgi:DNA polymerase-3 subunit epsilon
MLSQSIVMLDFETTGLSPDMGDRITEVAALRIADGRITERFVSLVNCGVRIPSFITHLTGISQQMVDGAPPASEVVPQLLAFIGSDPLSAHNASFDEKFLRAEAQRLGQVSGHCATICSLKLARRVLPDLGSYKLGALGSHLGIRFRGTAHRAEADAEVSAELLLHIGRHIARTYGIAVVAPELLVGVNKLAAAKVPAWLQKQCATQTNL